MILTFQVHMYTYSHISLQLLCEPGKAIKHACTYSTVCYLLLLLFLLYINDCITILNVHCIYKHTYIHADLQTYHDQSYTHTYYILRIAL